jgi:hypothetical protein
MPRKTKPADSDSFRYDVFISYSHRDEDWVQNWLLPKLEAAGLRVFIDFRDFEPGAPNLTEMERGVSQSRKTVLILTPDYLQSQWTEFEVLLVQTSDPAARRRRILPLLLKPCELPARIGMLNYLDFTRPDRVDFQLARLIAAIKSEATRSAAAPPSPPAKSASEPAPAPASTSYAVPASAPPPPPGSQTATAGEGSAAATGGSTAIAGHGNINITGGTVYIGGDVVGRDKVAPAPAAPGPPVLRQQELRVDAAVPNQVYLGRTFDLAVAVRQLSSPVLAEADLPRVHSGQVEVDLREGEPFLRLQIQVSAPECEIHGEDRQSFRLHPGHDSPVFYFHLTPKKLGEIGIAVTVYQENDWMGSARVHTLVREEMVGRVQMVVTSHTFQQPGEEPIVPKDDPLLKMSPAQLHKLLCKNFNLDELRFLCRDLPGVDWDSLPGESRDRKALELIGYMERRDRLPELAVAIRRARPNI